MAKKQVPVKKYVVHLSAEEREELLEMIGMGKRPGRTLMKARILLKADVSDAGAARSDSKIVAALETSIRTVERTRRELVEGGRADTLSSIQSKVCTTPNFRRRGRGQADRTELRTGCGWLCQMDATAARRKGR